MAKRVGASTAPERMQNEEPSELLRELVAHLRQNRTQLREEWVRRISETRLLTAMTKEEIFAEATSVYGSYVEALETERSRRCKVTFEIFPNALSLEVWKLMRSLELFCCSVTSSHALYLQSIRRISRN